MGVRYVDIDYFFNHYRVFPWDIMGLCRPGIGPLHVYLCRAAATFIRDQPTFYFENCTYSELVKFADRFKGIAAEILSCSDYHSDKTLSTTRKEEIVVDWLSRQYGFKKAFAERLDYLYERGMIDVPEAALLYRVPKEWTRK